MDTDQKISKFAKFAWFALAYNVVVILWGVFLRASKSGDGCGQHWLTCHGEVIPSAPEMKTVIEFSHRATSGLAFVVVLALLIWTFRKFPKGSILRKTAVGAFIFIVTEALVGAGLVLTGNTAEALTAARPFWMIGHLTNTFILLAFLSLTAWFASGGKVPQIRGAGKPLILIALGFAGIFFVGMTGSIAALSNMLFPSESIAAGIREDLSSGSNILLRLRIFHPFSSIAVGIFLIFLSGWLRKISENHAPVVRWSNILSLLVILQLAFGAVTLLTGAPIVMQVIHLFLADAVWVSYLLLSVVFLARREGL